MRSSLKSTRRPPEPASPCSTPKASRWTASNSAAKARRNSPSALAIRGSGLGGQCGFRQSPGAAGRAAAMVAAGRGRRIVEMLGQRRRRPLGPRARRARPSRFLANDRTLRPRNRRSQEARRRGPPHPLAKPAGPRAERADHGCRCGFARQGGRGRRRHEDRCQGESPQAWTQRIARLAPEGSSPAAWRYACTLQALAAAGANRRSRDRSCIAPCASVWAIFARRGPRSISCRMRPSSGGPARTTAQRQLELWDRLGREVLNAGARADFELYQQAVMQTSFGDPPEHSGPISWELARDAMLLFYVEHRETRFDPHGESRHVLAGRRPAGRRLACRPATRPIAAMVQCPPAGKGAEEAAWWRSTLPRGDSAAESGGDATSSRNCSPPWKASNMPTRPGS